MNTLDNMPASVVRRQFIPQATKTAAAAIGRVLTQLAHLADERVDLLLLLKNGLVELLDQVFGKAGLDFKVHQAFVNVGVGHGVVCFYLIVARSARKFSNWSL